MFLRCYKLREIERIGINSITVRPSAAPPDAQPAHPHLRGLALGDTPPRHAVACAINSAATPSSAGGPPRRHGEDWHSEARQSGWSRGPSRSALHNGYPCACTALTNGASGGDGVAKGDGAFHNSLRPRLVGPHTPREGGPPPRVQDTRPRVVARPHPGKGTPALQDQWRHAPHPRRRAVAAQGSPY